MQGMSCQLCEKILVINEDFHPVVFNLFQFETSSPWPVKSSGVSQSKIQRLDKDRNEFMTKVVGPLNICRSDELQIQWDVSVLKIVVCQFLKLQQFNTRNFYNNCFPLSPKI